MPPRNSSNTMEHPPRSPTPSSPRQRIGLNPASSGAASPPLSQPNSPSQQLSSSGKSSSRKLRKGTRRDSERDSPGNIERSSLMEVERRRSSSNNKNLRSSRQANLGSSNFDTLEGSEGQVVSPSSVSRSDSPGPSRGRRSSPRPYLSHERIPSSPRASGTTASSSLRPSSRLSRSPRRSGWDDKIMYSQSPSSSVQRNSSPLPFPRKQKRHPSPTPSSRRYINEGGNSSRSIDDGDSSSVVHGSEDEEEEDWRGEFAECVGPQTGIPYILDNGIPSVPVLARGDSAKFHICITDHDWDKLEKLLKKFDARYYKKIRLQVKERRDTELLKLQEAEEEAKEADERAKAVAEGTASGEYTNSPSSPRGRRFFSSFSRNSEGRRRKSPAPQPPNSGGGLASKILPKSLAAKINVDPEEVLSPLLMVDDMERTPLHLACIHKAPETMLLDLLVAERKAALIKDQSGKLPLHFAIQTWQHDHVLEKIIRAFPHALKTKDNEGKTPIRLAVQLARERQEKESCEDPDKPFKWIHPTSQAERNWQFQQEKIWAKVNLLLKGLMKRNKMVLPSEHALILEALEAGANPNTVNRFVSTCDRYLGSDDELAGTAIGLCVERHFPLDTLEYLIDNCREKTTIITDAVTKALRTHYRLGCHPIRKGMMPFGKQVIDWGNNTQIKDTSEKISKEESPTKKEPEKKKRFILAKKVRLRFFGSEVDVDEGAGDKELEGYGDETKDDEFEIPEIDQWDGMDKSCKEWWEILNYLVFYSAYGRECKETVQPKSYHLLHAALSIPVTPPSLIQLLLIVYPESLGEVCPLYNALPIHIACTRWRYDIIRNESDSSLERVLKLMLKSNPEMTYRRHQGRLPIHLGLSAGQSWSFVKTFVAADRKCVGMRDPHSRFFAFQMAALPMTSKNVQLLMRSQFSPTEWRIMSSAEKKLEFATVAVDQDRKQIGTIFELLRRHPDALIGKPVSRVKSTFSDPFRNVGKVSKQYLAFVYGTKSQGDYRLRSENVKLLRDAIVRADIPLELENWWEKMKECIWDENLGDIPRDDQYLLHAALFNPETPPLLVELLLEIFPASVSKPVPGTATYPLHIAAATTAYHRHSFEIPYGMDNLHLVLSSDRRVSRRRSNGRLPLHICLARGKSWKEVRPLILADPSSLMAEDPHTGLVPFQLIASFNTTLKENALRFSAFIERQLRDVDIYQLSVKDRARAFNQIRKKQDLSQLTCIFELLRHRPSAMHYASFRSTPSESGSVFSSASYTLGSLGSDSYGGGAAARMTEFLSEISPSAQKGFVQGLVSTSRSIQPSPKGSSKNLESPNLERSFLSNISGHSGRSFASNDGSGVFAGYTKNTYDDDASASMVVTNYHSNKSNAASPGNWKKTSLRRGKRPSGTGMPPRAPDLDGSDRDV